MIDKNLQARLIKGAGGVYGGATAIQNKANQRTTKPGTNVRGNLPIDKYAQYNKQRREANRDKKFGDYLDGLNLNMDLSGISDNYRAQLMPQLEEKKAQAREVVRNLLKYKPGEEGYDLYNTELKMIENWSKQVSQQFTTLGTDTSEYITDYDNQNFSKANDDDVMDNLNNIYTDSGDISFDMYGNILFGGQKYKDIKTKQPFNKANTEANEFLQMSATLYGAGKPMNDAQKVLYQNKVNAMLSKGGWNTHKSLVTDNLLGDAFLSEPGMSEKVQNLVAIGDSDDPEASFNARQELQTLLQGRMLDVLDGQATAGHTAAQGEGSEGMIDYTDMDTYLANNEVIDANSFNATLPPGYKHLLLPRKIEVDGKYVDSTTEFVVIKATGDPSNYMLQQANPTTVFKATDKEAIKKYFRKLKK